MDKIFIKNLNLEMIIGIYPHEINKKQAIILDLELQADAQKAALTDNIKHTIDYDRVVEYINLLCNQHQFKLIETLAEFLASNIIETFHTNWIKITITKPYALLETKEVGIVIERRSSKTG